MTSRYGGWIQTYSGVQFFPLDPRPEDVRFDDIAHALARQCRFAGHCEPFYSVAQHSVLVSLECPAPLALLGLLHDAAEAYLVDLPSPLKHMPELACYRTWEQQLLGVIQEALLGTVCLEMPEAVKVADLVLLATEARDLLGPTPVPWTHVTLPSPLTYRVRAWDPDEAEYRFRWRFETLMNCASNSR